MLKEPKLNLGKNNFSKYFDEMFPGESNKPYCTAFIEWLFAKRYGYEEGKVILGIKEYSSSIAIFSRQLRDSGMIVSDPQVGDLILFVKNQWIDHVGLIVGMDESTFNFISGNVYNADKIGCVVEEVCNKDDKTIVLFARPKY